MGRYKLAEQRQTLNNAMADYDKRFATATKAYAAQHTISETIALPAERQNCATTMLGQRFCVPVAHIEQRVVPKLTQFPDPAVKFQLDEAFAKINNQSAQATASSQKMSTLDKTNAFVRNLMAPLISLVILGANLFVILSRGYKAEGEKWAFGSVGMIAGFWLK